LGVGAAAPILCPVDGAMHSIQTRLKLMFIVIVTVVLAVSGTVTQRQLERELEDNHQRLRQGVLTRLQISLPSALWDLDKSKVESIIEAEMLPPEVEAIRVYDSAVGLFAGRIKEAGGAMRAAAATDQPAGSANTAGLVFQDRDTVGPTGDPVAVGQVTVNFSRGVMDSALRKELLRKVGEIVVLDLILVAALSLSLRVVFKPLQGLRDGLFAMAARGADEIEELPERRRDELGDVVRGFNQIQRRLLDTIGRVRAAEEEARNSAEVARLALQDLRATQESLLQAEKLASLGGLVAGVAHEINTPVGIALTSASVLKDATDDIRASMAGSGVRRSELERYIDTAQESARLIMNNAYRAAHLIHSFKQIAVDQTSEARRQFNLAEYIGEVIASLEPALKKTPLQLQVDCPADIELDGYPGALAQVLTNLVLNCVHHAFAPGQQGTISVRARLCDEAVQLDVADNGRGIPADALDRVFDPFFTTRRGQGGTGLGLNIVHNIVVKQFGGSISVESVPGQGAHFILRFPRTSPGAGEPAENPGGAASALA
jgi:signal transduction histidine kinase